MRYLTLGALPLYQDGFSVLNEGGLLSWDSPARTFVTRGNYPALVSGEASAGTPATIALQVLVQTSSVEATQFRMNRLHAALYSTRYAEVPSPSANRMGVFDLRDGQDYDSSWVLKACVLSSSVDLKRYDNGRTYVATFTLTSPNPYWRAAVPTDLDISTNVVTSFQLGGSPSGDYQVIFAIEDTVRIGWQDYVSQTYWRMNTADVPGFVMYSGETKYIRFDSNTGTAGFVDSMSQFSGNIPYSDLGYLTHLVVQPRSGFALYPNQNGTAMCIVTAATATRLRYWPNKAVI